LPNKILFLESSSVGSKVSRLGSGELAKGHLTKESAFNVGGSSGRVYVTRKASEEYDATCLLPQFGKLETIHI